MAQFKPKQLTKQQLVKPILECLCKLCAEPAPEDHDQEDQLSASKFASQHYDMIMRTSSIITEPLEVYVMLLRQ